MAFTFYTSGAAYVSFAGADLGFCEDRVQIVVQPSFDEVHTDSWGGLAGPFADRQLLGAVAQIQCLFTKYDKAELDKLTSFVTGGTAGVIGSSKLGEFIYQDTLYDTLDINGTNETLTFDYAHIAAGVEFNSSMRHRRYQATFMARMDDACARNLFTIAGSASCVD